MWIYMKKRIDGEKEKDLQNTTKNIKKYYEVVIYIEYIEDLIHIKKYIYWCLNHQVTFGFW